MVADSDPYLFSEMNPFYIKTKHKFLIMSEIRVALRNKAVYVYKSKDKGTGRKSVADESKAQLQKKYSAKGLSETAKKDIRRRVDNWQWAVNASQQLWSRHKEKRRRYFVLITLTLCAKQMEDDKTIKRRYLNVWLQNLERVHKGINWLWVAECQQNGNIHFHVVVDRWVGFEWIKRSWNRVMANGDMVERFKAKFKKSDPPSVNVKGQKSMGNPAAYITKYLTGEKKVRDMDGRCWGCCDRLREFDHWYLPMGDLIETDICRYFTHTKPTIKWGEYSHAFYFDHSLLINGVWRWILQKFKPLVCESFGRMYPELWEVARY